MTCETRKNENTYAGSEFMKQVQNKTKENYEIESNIEFNNISKNMHVLCLLTKCHHAQRA